MIFEHHAVALWNGAIGIHLNPYENTYIDVTMYVHCMRGACSSKCHNMDSSREKEGFILASWQVDRCRSPDSYPTPFWVSIYINNYNTLHIIPTHFLIARIGLLMSFYELLVISRFHFNHFISFLLSLSTNLHVLCFMIMPWKMIHLLSQDTPTNWDIQACFTSPTLFLYA